MCGEKLPELDAPLTEPGSPPHVRGKVLEGEKCRKRERITPACAGKSNRNSGNRNSGEDHPRMCGEKFEHFGKG